MNKNEQDTDDAKYFVLGLSVGIIVGTASTFIGNILSHKWLLKEAQTQKLLK
jgi:hypothetical protein